jgi:hypothetical protein
MADAYRLSGSDETEINTSQDMSEKASLWFARFGAAVIEATKHFLRTTHPTSHRERAERALEKAGALTAPTDNVVATLSAPNSFTVSVTAEVKVDIYRPIDNASTALVQEEIQRRRDLVRILFNDFWSGDYEKPATFVERLDQAEDYVNERLAETGELWQLDPKTRGTLGLPPRSNSPG